MIKRLKQRWVFIMAALFLTGCFHPPYNQFRKNPPASKKIIQGLGVGAAVGAATGTTVVGVAVGGTVGLINSIYHNGYRATLAELIKNDIQFVQYGDTKILIIPTDHYYLQNSSKLNNRCYEGLNTIVRFLKFFPYSTFYVAGFTDNVGSTQHKQQRSEDMAETMLTFLWANNIAAAKDLHAVGFGDRHAIADNHWIRGSAMNRRIEIQWITHQNVPGSSKTGSAMK